MIRYILTLFLLVVFMVSSAQKVNLNSPVVATAGNESLKSASVSPVNISKWRIGEIYLVTLPDNKQKDDFETLVNVYPNPCKKDLNIEVKTQVTDIYQLKITDMNGRQIFYETKRTIEPGQTIQIDLSKLNPALYILALIPSNQQSQWMVKIQKQY